MGLKFKDTEAKSKIYENERATEVLKTEVWAPIFEIINDQGGRQTPNVRIEIFEDNKVTYRERFFGTFSSNMNFKNFPYDSQTFVIAIEAYSYSAGELIFINKGLFLNSKKKLGQKEFIEIGRSDS